MLEEGEAGPGAAFDPLAAAARQCITRATQPRPNAFPRVIAQLRRFRQLFCGRPAPPRPHFARVAQRLFCSPFDDQRPGQTPPVRTPWPALAE